MTNDRLVAASLPGGADDTRSQMERTLELALGPSDRILRQLEAADPMRHFRESSSYQKLVHDMRRSSEVAAGFARQFEAMKTWVEPPAMAAYREAAKHYERQSNSLQAIAENERRLRDTLSAQLKAFSAGFADDGGAVAAFRQIASEGRAIREAMEGISKWTTPLKEQARHWERYNDSTSWSSFKGLLEGLSKASSAVGAFHLGSDEGDEPEESESQRHAAEAMGDIVEKAAAQSTFREAVDEIVAAIENTRGTPREKYLWMFLVPFLIALFTTFATPVADFYEKKLLEQYSSPQAETKAVKQAARDAVTDVQVLSDYRFVSSRRPLVVLATAGAKSAVVAQLRFGQAVRVLKKDGDFTLIAWTSEDKEVHVQGWVFSRYLKRFD